MISGPIKAIKFFHETKEAQRKILAIGDAGPGGTQATCVRAGNGIDCGAISGSPNALFCCVNTKAEEQKVKTKVYSGGESGEIFMHEGTPFSGQGQILERYPGEYINSMALDEEAKRLYVVTAGKKIVVFDTDSQEKLCEKAGAHSKGIYGVDIVSQDEASIITCSADNNIKKWKFNEDSKELEELDAIYTTTDE